MNVSSRRVLESRFPDPRTVPGDRPLALGGDLSPEWLLDAYDHGIFPWPDDEERVWWWSPDPRAVFPIGGVHVSRSLRRTLRSGTFTVTADTAFDDVTWHCADRDEGTWITSSMRKAYHRMFELGRAHSIEVWQNDELVGGVYGVTAGTVFTGESMFHRVSDASKVALVALDRTLQHTGFTLIDAQLHTDHLETLGVNRIERDVFLRHVEAPLSHFDATDLSIRPT